MSCRKKIGPLQWDLSVAEHLQPGESYREVVTLLQSLCQFPVASRRLSNPGLACSGGPYCDVLPLPELQSRHGGSVGLLEVTVHGMLVQAASRGLQEELGVSTAATSLKGPLVPTHLRQLHVPEVAVTDCEFVTSFRSALCQALYGRLACCNCL